MCRSDFEAAARSFLLSVLVLLGAVGMCDAAPSGDTRELWVEVRINNVSCSEFALLHIDLRGHLYVRLEDVWAWHLTPPSRAEADGLVRIDDFAGVRAHLDADETVLRIEADPSLFAAQVITGNNRAADAPDRGVPAVFMGYNLFAEHGGGAGDSYSALIEAGSSLGRASFTSTWLGTHFVDAPTSAQAADNGSSGLHRLDTDLLLDFPEDTARLTLGDSVTSPGTLGQSVRFTGVHWATDYGTRPGLTPYALPVVSGTATMPSSVELYVNQALIERTTVDSGPFELNNIPVPVGEGTVDIRMRDILGQEQQLSVPYLVTPQLIAAGLTTVDLAAGAVREDYGIENFAYGQSFLSGGMQHGVSDTATINASGEVLSDEVTARGGAAIRMTRNFMLELTPALSHSSGEGTGAAVDTGIDAVWPATTFGVHYRDATPDFVELGNLAPGDRLHTEWAAQASTQLGRSGSLGVLYAWRRSYDAPTTAATTLSYNVSLRGVGAIGVFVSDTRSGATTDVIGGLIFTRYLGKGVTASVTGTSDNGASTVDMQIGQAAPPDVGWGWQLAHARGGTNTDGVQINGRDAYGTGSGEIDSTPAGTMGILAWQGGFLWAGGRPWPAQTLSGPAALVVIPDLADVEVLHDGQPVGRTDAAGRILVPALRPFEDNTLTLVPEDIPLTAMVDSNKITVRPYSHGVVSAAMPVAGSDSRVFTLRLEHGGFVPTGAQVVLGGHEFPVGTQGVAQLPVGHAATDGVVSWPGARCRVHLPAAKHAGDGPLTLSCRKG
jgi:outer membrane usher protein